MYSFVAHQTLQYSLSIVFIQRIKRKNVGLIDKKAHTTCIYLLKNWTKNINE